MKNHPQVVVRPSDGIEGMLFEYLTYFKNYSFGENHIYTDRHFFLN